MLNNLVSSDTEFTKKAVEGFTELLEAINDKHAEAIKNVEMTKAFGNKSQQTNMGTGNQTKSFENPEVALGQKLQAFIDQEETTNEKSSLNNLEYLDISQEVNALQVPNTPFLSYLLGAGKVEAAKSTEIKWREYGMNNDDSSAQLEGGEYADAESDRTWFNNYTEIFRKSTSVSGTLDAINVDGVGNELNSQVALRATEMKIDLNRKLIVGVKADESGSKGRQMNGILNLISSTNKVETAAAGQ